MSRSAMQVSEERVELEKLNVHSNVRWQRKKGEEGEDGAKRFWNWMEVAKFKARVASRDGEV